MADAADSLHALAMGDYARWRGLPDGVDRAAADAALGPGGDEHAGILAGMPATYRIHPPAEGAPFGVQVWLEGDLVGVLEIRDPPLREPLDVQLGEPEARVESGLGGSYRQWVYATRGLVFHVSAVTGSVLRMYAFPAIETDAFLAHPLRHVARRRIPRG